MTPDLAFMEAVRERLTSTPAVVSDIDPVRIRAGSILSETLPCIVLGSPRTTIKGYAAGGQIVARIEMMLHLWALADAAESAHMVGGAMLSALMDPPRSDDLCIDRWERPSMVWISDPGPQVTRLHGVFDLSAVVRWRA